MHQPVGPDDPAAERCANRLVAEADAEHRHPAGEGPDERDENPGIFGRARARRQDGGGGLEREHLLDRERIVAIHDRFRAELPEQLDEVVGERVVVVEHEEHGGI